MEDKESIKKYKTFSEDIDINKKIDTYRNFDGNVSYCKARKCPIVINLLNENERLQQENAKYKEQLKDKDKEIEFVRKAFNESLRLSREKQKKLNSIKDILESNKED